SPVPNLDPRAELPTQRLLLRRALAETVDAQARHWTEGRAAVDMDVRVRQAMEMLAEPRCRRAFDLTTESDALRDRYGRHRSGQSLLLARRLVEAAVPFVTVVWNHDNRGQDVDPTLTDVYGWDTHNDIFEAMKNHLLPRFDQSFATFLEDMEQRGLLDETLVVCMSEFGRAPRVALERRFAGGSPGRKHWASVYSAIVAGAGTQKGLVYGSSDRIGGYPGDDRVGPWDLAATMYHSLGIDPAGHFLDAQGRPASITVGRPIIGLYD
ncbi:MAG: DUF1501 domain-containing protein, partial [Planctomycetia bacterium]